MPHVTFRDFLLFLLVILLVLIASNLTRMAKNYNLNTKRADQDRTQMVLLLRGIRAIILEDKGEVVDKQ